MTRTRFGTSRLASVLRSLQTLGSTLIDLLYPQTCCGCETLLAPGARAAFCAPCAGRVRPLNDPLCPSCGRPLATGDIEAGSSRTLEAGSSHTPPCPECSTAPPPFARARAWAYYSTAAEEKNPLARALWAFKYDGRLDIGHRLGRVLAMHTPFAPGEHDVIVPVPLHAARLRHRGFNQACVLAVRVARRLRAPVGVRALGRPDAAPPQVSLPEATRRANVRGAFVVRDGRTIAHRRVLLVDDVLTTGATAGECARALRVAGAAAVDVLTVARAVRT